MTGLRLKQIGLEKGEKDIYSTHDEFVVHEPWKWGPQHLHLAGGTQHTSSSGPEHSAHTAAFGRPMESASPAALRTNQWRRVVPLTAEQVFEDSIDLGFLSFEGGRQTTEMKDDELVLLYPLTFGFSLKEKRWSTPSLDHPLRHTLTMNS